MTRGTLGFVYTGGALIDWGECYPGQSPGADGASIRTTDADGALTNFTGCPEICKKGAYGTGGEASDLRAFDEGCTVGCLECPAGAICPHDEMAAQLARVQAQVNRLSTENAALRRDVHDLIEVVRPAEATDATQAWCSDC